MISIIVPVYNVEKYLDRCVRSLLSQTLEDIEILLINDGSTDSSSTMCDEFAAMDSRVTVIHQVNQGLSAARNAGIAHAKYDYLGFVDSDDWVTSDMFQYMHDLIIASDADVVDVGFMKSSSNEVTAPVQKAYEVSELQGDEILRDYLNVGDYSVWKKLYKKSLFSDTEFPVGKLFEDITTNFKLLEKAKKLVKSDKVCYFYFINEGSITQQGFRTKDLDLLEMGDELLELAHKKNDPSMIRSAEIRVARSYFSLLGKISRYGFRDKSVNQKEMTAYLTKNLRKHLRVLLFANNIPLNRKMMIVLTSVDYRIVSTFIALAKKLSLIH